MNSPQPDADADMPTRPASGRKLMVVLVLGCLVIEASFFGRRLLIQRSENAVYDSTPTPRPRLNAPYVISDDAVVDKMVELAQISKDDVVYDLGCGDGRIIVTAALRSGCRGVGFDLDPERVAEANRNVEIHDVSQSVSIKQQDIFEVDLSKANVAVMYLLPWMMQKLTPQFEQMQPGSRIVSHDFYIEGVEPERVAQVQVNPNDTNHYIFVYTTPLRWNPDMPKKPPVDGFADRADAAKAAAEHKAKVAAEADTQDGAEGGEEAAKAREETADQS